MLNLNGMNWSILFSKSQNIRKNNNAPGINVFPGVGGWWGHPGEFRQFVKFDV